MTAKKNISTEQDVNSALKSALSILNLSKLESSIPTTKRALISFITDDGGAIDFTRLKPLFESKGAKLNCAVRTDGIGTAGSMSIANLLELQSAGHEILSHTWTHQNLTTLTEAQIEEQYATSLSMIKGWGLNCVGLCYPFGAYNKQALNLARKYFDFAYATSSEGYTQNNTPLDQFAMSRMSVINGANNLPISIDVLKSYVDDCLTEKSYLVFVVHAAEFLDTAQGNINLQHLTDLLDYIVTKAIPIVSASTAMAEKRNAVDFGNFKETYVKISLDGAVKSSYDEKYKIVHSSKTVDDTTLLTTFEKGKVTYSVIVALGNFPDTYNGILITNRLASNDVFAYQEYHPAGNYKIHKRVWNAGSWGAWYSLKPILNYSQTINFGSIAAGAFVESERTVAEATLSDVAIASPNGVNGTGLIWTTSIDTVGKVKIKIFNANSTAQTIASSWKIVLIKQ